MTKASRVILISSAIVVLVCCISLADSASSLNLDIEWAAYKGKYRKRYSSSSEDDERKVNYIKELDKIEKHNRQTNVHWKMGVNQFSDMSMDEKVSILRARRPDSTAPKNYLTTKFNGKQTLKSEIDLRHDSCMPPIKDQGVCGSCYAYAAVTPLEYLHCKQNNDTLTLFSEQQLVDCDPKSAGCSGGWYSDSWDYLTKNGLMASTSYPYESGLTNQTGECRFDESRALINVKEHFDVQPSAAHMAMALNHYGPLAVAFVAVDDFFSYSSGVYHSDECSTNNKTENHALVIVGYGHDPEAGAYWVARNSWGPVWGIEGYGLIRRGLNACLIESYPAFPVLA